MAKEKLELVPASSNVPAVQAEWESDWQAEMEKGGFNLPQIAIVREKQLFELPPGDKYEKTFQGIYLGEVRFNIKFPPKDEGDDSKTPPECVARDAQNGSRDVETIEVVDPKTNATVAQPIFGKCASCWFNKFGSGKDGTGKACQNKSSLMIWPTGIDAVLPYLLNVPVTSLTYRILSAPNGISNAGAVIRAAMPVLKAPPTAIHAEFFLEKQTKGAWVWSTLNAKVLGVTSQEDYRRCADFAKKYMPWLTEKAAEVDQTETTDAEVVDDPPADKPKDAPFAGQF